jgi:hypothetical protein
MIKRYRMQVTSGASGVSCFFDVDTSTSGNASFFQATVNIVGAAGAVVIIQVTTYTNNNSGGSLKVNGSLVFLGDSFNVTLNGSGNGSFVCRIDGNPSDSDSVVRGVFTIMGVSIGQVSLTSFTHQESKVY